MWKTLLAAGLVMLLPLAGNAQEVKITEDMLAATVETPDGPVEIKRNQDTGNKIEDAFAKTSRKCPPFCIQPMHAAPGVETVGELEVIDFLKEKKGMLIDARTTDWHLKGTIPGSVNIPYTEITDRMDELGCSGGDCSGAKTIMLYCNGPWCGQSPTAIHNLLKAGYPAEKMLYYRGGIQNWRILGLNLVEGSIM